MNSLTIVVTTNPCKSWSPSTSLIERVINQPVFESLKLAKWLICCDVVDNQHTYYQNLKKLTNLPKHTSILHNTPKKRGLKWSFIRSSESITTPYVIFLEHDWLFQQDINWHEIVDVLDLNPQINKISFNKRNNVVMKPNEKVIPFKSSDPVVTDSIRPWLTEPDNQGMCDTYLEEDRTIRGCTTILTKALRWSNNPYICRSSMYRNWTKFINDQRNGNGSGGIEDKLVRQYRSDCYTMGWHAAFKKWGVYLYGGLNHPAVVTHLDGRKYTT